ncbi:glycosyltransferase family 39 protein [Kitasatospora atroaurantiaca]|uniref:glycosyltransferase family 39 protein n=1 Tax=Kitasatospora atroaurantiaca TaxID=285545 RepID=UPI001FE94F3E|nr:glycosyltransferase family 39 protein [Kitasatospora atroaurantiaca]
MDPDRLGPRTSVLAPKDPTTDTLKTADHRGGGTKPAGAPAGPSARPSGYLSALIAYGVLKLIGFAVFLQLLAASGQYRTKDPRFGGGTHVWDVVGAWDGWWYQQIATHGYHFELLPAVGQSGTHGQSPAAFLPLYPGLIRLVSTLTGLGTYGAGMLLSVIFSFVAAAGVFAVTARLRGNRVGVIAAGLWAVFPGSGFEWAVFGEPLFVALAAWTCYAVMTRHWFTAATLAFLAGLDRPAAAALIAVVGLSGLGAMVRRQKIVGPLVAVVVAPLGLLGYLLWVGDRTGDLLGYVTAEQDAWLRHFGHNIRHTVPDLLLGRSTFSHPAEDLLGLLLLLAAPCLLFLLLRLRPPLVLTLHTVLVLVLGLGTGQLFDHLSRYLLAAFPLLIPLATTLRRLKLPSLTVLLAMAAAASGWFAGFVLFELGVP